MAIALRAMRRFISSSLQSEIRGGFVQMSWELCRVFAQRKLNAIFGNLLLYVEPN